MKELAINNILVQDKKKTDKIYKQLNIYFILFYLK